MRSLFFPHHTFWHRCLVLFFSYLFLGFLLQFYQVSKFIWIFTYLSISYLSWSGTGAIALVMFVIFMIIGISFFLIDPNVWFQNFITWKQSSWFRFLSHQLLSVRTENFKFSLVVLVWIFMFLFMWIIGIGITFYHGLTQGFIEDKIETRITVFLLLNIIAIIGIQLGKLFVQ